MAINKGAFPKETNGRFRNDTEKQIDTHRLFQNLDTSNSGVINLEKFLEALEKEGILGDDNRLESIYEELKGDNLRLSKSLPLNLEKCDHFLHQSALLRHAFSGNLIIPDFEDFSREIKEIFEATKSNRVGKVADYIPQLARVDPEYFAVSMCTIDGQRFSIGDFEEKFCLQSTCKMINYCLASAEHGEQVVHQHVGREPSGRSFNELSLNNDGLPHNPLINAGAIMSCSLIKPGKSPSDRFDHVSSTWNRLCAGRKVGFNNSVYLSERSTADRNFALAYFMRENQAFPEKTDLLETLEFYFQCCSIESNTANLSIAAATLANAGVNPLTGEKIFDEKTVQHCLSLMLTCGMYDFSGEFAFNIGLPAKSGVSGCMMVVVPNVMGITIWSPRLDELGNSVRGVEFCRRLVEKYNFHQFDSIVLETNKKDPRRRRYDSAINHTLTLIYAAGNGDLGEIKRLNAEKGDLSVADYDGRTAMHLAASEGQLEVVKYLIEQGVPLEPIDRWGGTPQKDAQREGHQEVVEALEQALAAKNA